MWIIALSTLRLHENISYAARLWAEL